MIADQKSIYPAALPNCAFISVWWILVVVFVQREVGCIGSEGFCLCVFLGFPSFGCVILANKFMRLKIECRQRKTECQHFQAVTYQNVFENWHSRFIG